MRSFVYLAAIAALATAVIGTMVLQSTARAADSAALAVIVAHTEPLRMISITEASLIFWRKKLYWADGKRMQPVNLPTSHALRRQFSQVVLGSLPDVQTEYWNGLYFHGTSPPHVVASQEAMLRFVAETPGAIGYVDACKVDGRVKVVLWINEAGVALVSAPTNQDCPP